MFRKMRRFKQRLTNDECITILKNSKSGVLAVSGDDGYPYTVPLNFVYADGKIYFHCAKNEGHKQENMRFSGKVSFTVVTKSDVISEKFTTGYESAVAFGIASKIVTDKEKALRLLVKKYSPDFINEGESYIKGGFERTDVFAVEIERLTAKANKI